MCMKQFVNILMQAINHFDRIDQRTSYIPNFILRDEGAQIRFSVLNFIEIFKLTYSDK